MRRRVLVIAANVLAALPLPAAAVVVTWWLTA